MNNIVVDYVVFGLLILATLTFNIYNNVSGPKEKTKADYVFASGRSTSTWAMLLSIARGFLGVRVFLGYPSELFYRGSEMWETMYGMCLAFPVVAYCFVPVYFTLGITSVYQYLDLRFKSRLVRCLASGTYVIRNLLNLGVTVFTPCVALKTVIGMPYWMSIVGISTIGIFLTLTGGLRSAIMADVIQGLAMIFCSIIVIIQGSITAEEGVKTVIKKSYDRGRLDFFDFDLDPTRRVTTITALVGQFFISLSLYGCQQNFVQRYLSMKTQQKVTKTLWLNVPFMALLMSLSWVVGMVIFAHYSDCDPKELGYINDIDEILPFYIEDKFVFLPGFLGLTMACLFNGGLSFLVSNLNSLATVIWEDFLAHLQPLKNLGDTKQLYIIKATAAILGVFIGIISFFVSYFSGVIESSMLMTSATSGPLLGVFILAMFVPIANWKGASVGMIVSHVVTLWVTVNALLIEKPPISYLPTTIQSCTNHTFSQHISPLDLMNRRNFSVPSYVLTNNDENDDDYREQPYSGKDELDLEIKEAKRDDFVTALYKMTYMYYALFGTCITVFVGIVVSYITGTDEEYRYSDDLIHPMVKKMCSWLPGKRSCFEIDSSKTKSVSVNEKVDPGNQKMKLQTISECYKNSGFVSENSIPKARSEMGSVDKSTRSQQCFF